MARKLDAMPPPMTGRGGRSSVWEKFADGEIWELSVYDDLGYTKSPVELSQEEQDKYDHAAQTKAQNSARRWGANNGYHVYARRQVWDKVVVMFTMNTSSNPVVS